MWTELGSKPDLRGQRFVTNAYAKARPLSTNINLSYFKIFRFFKNLLQTILELFTISVTEFQTIDKLRSEYELKISLLR